MKFLNTPKSTLVLSITLLAVLPWAHSLADEAGALTNSNIMGVDIEIIKHPKENGRVKADEFIKLFGKGDSVTDVNVPETRRKMFEIAQHEKTAIWSAATINAKFNLAHDSNIRFLAREEYDGFSVKWAERVNFRRRFAALGHTSKNPEKHYFYFVLDTDDDQVGDRVYKVFVDFNKSNRSNIKGYASKTDGSSITPLEAKNAGL